ncbi:MAG TPA: DHHA1 domain-containing protein [Candidatus Pacearchaeota archaeon]|nr:DHHA1 domain-containing protein [Candidatus Pacearchaeota archaeon]
MLTKNQEKEIREHLSNAQNPVFFFDNDQDGLCSFLLLQRYIGRGKGFPIKTSPALTKDYLRKVEEFNSDYIFILDKPEISEEFVKEIEKKNIPIIWIDHHETPEEKIPKYVNYYNPLFNKEKSNEPVTYLCYKITKRKEDLWLAIVGCISDNLVPDFYKDFIRDFPDLGKDDKDAFNIFYGSDIGKIARIIGFGLKDKISNVISMIKFLLSCKNPYDFLEENNKNKSIHKRFHEIDKKYQKFLEKAKKNISGNLVIFKYSGETSMSSDIANGLKYLFPDKIIFTIYAKGAKANISGRGKNVRDLVLKAIDGLETATGGGHENAVGAQIRKEDIEEFERRIQSLIKN